jgi:hypothetical protein
MWMLSCRMPQIFVMGEVASELFNEVPAAFLTVSCLCLQHLHSTAVLHVSTCGEEGCNCLASQLTVNIDVLHASWLRNHLAMARILLPMCKPSRA